jgi:hypothetical protein
MSRVSPGDEAFEATCGPTYEVALDTPVRLPAHDVEEPTGEHCIATAD